MKAKILWLLPLIVFGILTWILIAFFNSLKAAAAACGYMVEPTLAALDQALLLLIIAIALLALLMAVEIIGKTTGQY
jgi:hypothetical protein